MSFIQTIESGATAAYEYGRKAYLAVDTVASDYSLAANNWIKDYSNNPQLGNLAGASVYWSLMFTAGAVVVTAAVYAVAVLKFMAHVTHVAALSAAVLVTLALTFSVYVAVRALMLAGALTLMVTAFRAVNIGPAAACSETLTAIDTLVDKYSPSMFFKGTTSGSKIVTVNESGSDENLSLQNSGL